MKHVRKLLFLALFATVGTSLAPVPQAEASTFATATFYNDGSGIAWRWRYADIIGYRWVEGLPSGNGFRDRIREGAAKWNAYQPDQFQWSWVSGTYAAYARTTACSDLPKGKNGVHWADLPAPQIGSHRNCKATVTYSDGRIERHIWNMQIAFDSRTTWWTSTGDIPGTPGTGPQDLLSTATHEFGHGTGFTYGNSPPAATRGHFAEVDDHTCPDLNEAIENRETMCENAIAGTRWQRTPAAHEVAVFRGAY